MSRPLSRHPTAHELEILKIVWREGKVTARQVLDELSRKRKRAYTSIMTIMTIMTRKGYLRRTKVDGTNHFVARVSKPAVTKQMLRDLADRLFEGSAVEMVKEIVGQMNLSSAQRRELRNVIGSSSKRG